MLIYLMKSIFISKRKIWLKYINQGKRLLYRDFSLIYNKYTSIKKLDILTLFKNKFLTQEIIEYVTFDRWDWSRISKHFKLTICKEI